MNKELLLRVASAIEANPKHFDMELFFDVNGDFPEGGCGTTACIAGWADFLSSGRKNFTAFAEKNLFDFNSDNVRLKLELVEYDQWASLIYVSQWMNGEYKDAYRYAQTSQERARAAAEYVRWFVKECSS